MAVSIGVVRSSHDWSLPDCWLPQPLWNEVWQYARLPNIITSHVSGVTTLTIRVGIAPRGPVLAWW